MFLTVNPAVWSIATFPFLFAIMFGDVGHGLVMFLIVGFLIIFKDFFEKKTDMGEMFKMIMGAKYLLLLMSLCSIYVGLLYNEFFAIPMFLDTTNWKATNSTFAVQITEGYTFPFGVDPAWRIAQNELLFSNSLKMKLR